MDVRDAVLNRRSIRAFEPRPVPREVLKGIMETALWAPSWGNTQPWGFLVVSGDPLQQIKKESVELLRQGVPPKPEVDMPGEWKGPPMERYRTLGKALFHAMGIQRHEADKRNAHYEQMSLSFGAPHTLYLHLHEEFHPYSLMDGGIILQTIALLAVEAGLGTCYLARSVVYPEVIRRHAQIPPGRKIVLGMAIGYPVKDHPINVFRPDRGAPEEFLVWVE
jgi:nitroreductase